MRIGLMLRCFDQHEGGVKVYTRELLEALLAFDRGHEFVLFFRGPVSGVYSHLPWVEEVALPHSNALYWDQVEIPRAVQRHRIDVLFNPKYSIPLLGRCKTAWVCHGLDWYVMPEASRWADRLSHRYLIPRYARRTDALICVSETTRDHALRYLRVAPERVHTVYPGVHERFHTSIDAAELQRFRTRHGLPPRFVLYCGAVYPPKNFRRLIQAYARVGPAAGVPLVIAGGTNRFLSDDELREPERLGISGWVRRLGWLDHTQLPALYRLADALLLPSLYESVGLPLLEAMACGCPVLTSNRYGTREIVGDAGVQVNPEAVDDIATGLQRLLDSHALRTHLSRVGKLRASAFTWRRCAEHTLEVLEGLLDLSPSRRCIQMPAPSLDHASLQSEPALRETRTPEPSATLMTHLTEIQLTGADSVKPS